MPNIIIPLEYRRKAGEAIFRWHKEHTKKGQFGTAFVMPPEQQLPNGVLFIGVPDCALVQLGELGIPFEHQ